MSEDKRLDLFKSIKNGLTKSTRQMLERKIKLGEQVVVADANGMPITISAEEALRRLNAATE